MEAENEPIVEFTPDEDIDIDISFNSEIKLR